MILAICSLKSCLLGHYQSLQANKSNVDYAFNSNKYESHYVISTKCCTLVSHQ